jgi:hypothetical protein
MTKLQSLSNDHRDGGIPSNAMREQSLKPVGENTQAVPIVVPKRSVPTISHLDRGESPERLQPHLNNFGDEGGGQRSVAEVPTRLPQEPILPWKRIRPVELVDEAHEQAEILSLKISDREAAFLLRQHNLLPRD